MILGWDIKTNMEKNMKKRRRKILLRSQRGMTLVELVVSFGIVGIITVIGATVYYNSQKNIAEASFYNVMRIVARSIQKTAQNPEAVAFSALVGTNRPLESCAWTTLNASESSSDLISREATNLSSSASTICTATDPEKQQPFILYETPPKNKSFNANDLQVAGTDQNPVYYDIYGKSGCNPTDPKCVIVAKSYFWATCPRGANQIRSARAGGTFTGATSNCHRAQVINVRFQVSHLFNTKTVEGIVKGKGGLRRKVPSIPRDSNFWENGGVGGRHTVNNALAIDVSKLGLYADYVGNCDKNYTLIEVVDSKPKCKCLPPYKEKEYALSKICVIEDHHCDGNTRYVGSTSNGDPICKPIFCETKTVSINDKKSFDFSCYPDGWLSKVVPAGGQSKNCVCKKGTEGPDMEYDMWSYSCDFQCGFVITCCREQR